MPIEKWSDNVLIAHLQSDPLLSEDLQSLQEDIAGRHKVGVVLDLAGVKYVNSSHLARLLKIRQTLSEKQAKLILCSIDPQVWGTLLVTGLDKVFTVADN